MLTVPAVKVGGRGREIHFTLDDQAPLDELEQGIRDYLESTDGFFYGARIRLDVGRRLANQEDMARLTYVLKSEYQLQISELRTGAERLEVGLSERYGVRTAILPRLSAPFRDRTHLVRGACRSGTTMHHEGDLMVLGDVNPGAEVSAAGDVIVFGALMGMASAGVNGDEEAIVTALELNPTQLRISRHVEVAIGERKGKRTRGPSPEVAYVRGGQIVIEPFNGQYHRARGWEGP